LTDKEKQSLKSNINIFYQLDKLVSKGKRFDLKDSILITGSPRSGTTWLMEIFENIPGYTYLFEPLQSNFFPDSYKAGFRGRPYLPPEVDWVEGEEYLRKIFTGQIVSRLPPYGHNFKMTIDRVFNKKLIIKSIRLNKLLPWIDKRFQLRDITYIIRHPCAVVASQLKTGYGGYQDYPPYRNRFPTKDEIITEASNIDILDSNLIVKLKKIKIVEEILAAAWCLDNYVPLYHLDSHKWNMIIYEKLVTDGESEIKNLFSAIGEEDSADLAINQLKKPSMLTLDKNQDKIAKTNVQLSKWKKYLSKDKINKILSLVEDFGLDFYSDEIEPDYDSIKRK